MEETIRKLILTRVNVSFSLVSYVTVMWVAETAHHGMQIKIDLSRKNPFKSPQIRRKGRRKGKVAKASAVERNTENIHLNGSTANLFPSYHSISQLISNGSLNESLSITVSGSQRENRFRSRADTADNASEDQDEFSELEVTELAAEYLGQHGKLGYQTALFLLTFIGLLAYTQVFNASFQSQIWQDCPAYIPVLIFGVIVVPFSCMDLVEQVIFIDYFKAESSSIIIGIMFCSK